MNISVNCPSYKRPKVKSLQYLPFLRVWVDCGEYDEYVKENKGFEDNIVSVPKGVQGNVARIRNYILDTEFARGAEAVVIIDDDMRGMFRYDRNNKAVKIEQEDFMAFIEKYTEMCQELGFKLWGVNVNIDRRCYRQFMPFSFTTFIGGPFSCHLNNPLRYDENLPLKEDYDLTIQHCNEYRGVLRVNSVFYDVLQSENKGGCAVYRNRLREHEQFFALQKKWGSKIVRVDKTNWTAGKKKKHEDYNPIIKIPIKGV